MDKFDDSSGPGPSVQEEPRFGLLERVFFGAFHDFVINFLDFQGQTNFVRVFCVAFEQRISFGFQVIPLLLPNTAHL
jgi:hypothetical protein